MNSESAFRGALSDIRVLDLAGESGLFAGRMLGEFGADVIRVEPPGGDSVRKRRPFAGEEPGLESSLYHQHFNMNKRGITLDMRDPEGQQLVKRLAVHVDVVIETAPPGEMAELGLDESALRAANPRLIYVSITPFGQRGPMSRYRANDLVAVAMSGLMALNGFPDDPPNAPGAEQAYHMGSLAAVSGTLLALVERDRTPGGSGRRVDVSLQEAASMATLQTANTNYYTWHGQVISRRGLETAAGGSSLFQCRDGRWVSFVVPPPAWSAFVEWLNDESVEHGLAGEDWLDQRYRLQHGAAIAEATRRLVSGLDRETVFHEGQRRRLLTMPVNDVADLVVDPHLQARGFFVEVEHPLFETRLVDAGVPYKLSKTPAAIRRHAPLLGEHNSEVYEGMLGMSSDELERLSKRGVI